MKQISRACERNRGPILEVLRRALPDAGTVLEIASGTGMHAVHFARHLPHLTFQPTDQDPVALASIEAWRGDAALPNLRAPLTLDVTAQPWPLTEADAVINANMIHISPIEATYGLMAGAAAVLPSGGLLSTYGPYLIKGRETAPSNLAFDQSLRARDPAWGIRALEDIVAIARAAGLHLEEVVDMPANNVMVLYRRA